MALLTAGSGAFDGEILRGWKTGDSVDMKGFGSAIVAVSGLSGGDSIAIQGSLTGANPTTLAIANLGDTTQTLITSITADGHYLVPAAGQLSYVRTGSASTPVIGLMVKR